MNKFIIISSLFLLSVMIFADEHCMRHSRRCLRKSNLILVKEKRGKHCNCNCTQAMEKIAHKQHRGKCPCCGHFHIPSEVQFRKISGIKHSKGQ